MATYQQCFDGATSNEYAGIYDLELLPLGYNTVENGVTTFHPTSVQRNVVTFKSVETRYLFVGLDYAQAHATSAQTIAINGSSVSVPFASTVVDGSSGSRSFETLRVSVSRTPISPRMWAVEIVKVETSYFVNGTQVL